MDIFHDFIFTSFISIDYCPHLDITNIEKRFLWIIVTSQVMLLFLKGCHLTHLITASINLFTRLEVWPQMDLYMWVIVWTCWGCHMLHHKVTHFQPSRANIAVQQAQVWSTVKYSVWTWPRLSYSTHLGRNQAIRQRPPGRVNKTDRSLFSPFLLGDNGISFITLTVLPSG